VVLTKVGARQDDEHLSKPLVEPPTVKVHSRASWAGEIVPNASFLSSVAEVFHKFSTVSDSIVNYRDSSLYALHKGQR
jgi:hypothetical protein